MSQTAIQICNGALAKLGEKSITSFHDHTKASDLCRLRYPVLRDNLLRDHVWSFSRGYTTLSPMTESSGIRPWTYKFQLPADYARLVSVTRDEDEVEFELSGTVIHTRESSLDVRYVKDFSGLPDSFLFPPDFAETLSSLLAAELAVPMTQTQSLRDTFLNMYAERLRQARFNGATERNDQPVVNSSWLDAHDNGRIDIDPRRRGLAGY